MATASEKISFEALPVLLLEIRGVRVYSGSRPAAGEGSPTNQQIRNKQSRAIGYVAYESCSGYPSASAAMGT